MKTRLPVAAIRSVLATTIRWKSCLARRFDQRIAER